MWGLRPHAGVEPLHPVLSLLAIAAVDRICHIKFALINPNVVWRLEVAATQTKSACTDSKIKRVNNPGFGINAGECSPHKGIEPCPQTVGYNYNLLTNIENNVAELQTWNKV